MLNTLNLKENIRITKRLDTYDSGYLIGKSYFGDDGLQNHEISQILNILQRLLVMMKFYDGKM